jgi:hypothetical protein
MRALKVFDNPIALNPSKRSLLILFSRLIILFFSIM